jgi:ABC-type lipoprotein release transport system permease subunit
VGLAFTNGIIRQTIIGFTGTLIEDIMIFPDKGAVLENYQEIEKSLHRIKGIDYVTKKIRFKGVVFSETSSINAMLLGMEPEGIRRKTNLKMERGRYLQDDDRLSMILSEKLSRRLQVDVGDKIAVVVNTPGGGTNAKDLRVEGIFSVKTGLQFVDHLIYTSIWDTQDLMGLTDNQIFSLGVYLKDVDSVDLFEKRIVEKLERQGLPARVRSWKKQIKGLLSQYYFIKYIVFIFTMVLLAIVCVGVVNAVFISVTERTREIGTMMAMGAAKKTIFSIFMLEGALLTLVSALTGATLGAAVSLLFERIGFEAPSRAATWLFGGKNLYPYLTLPTVSFSFCFVAAITIVGMSYPIIQALRMEPTEALGYV